MTTLLSKDMLKEWGLSALPHDKQVDMVNRLGHLMYQAILVQALDLLSDTEQDEFDAILDEDNTTPEDVLGFLRSKIPSFDKLVEEERQKLKEEIVVE